MSIIDITNLTVTSDTKSLLYIEDLSLPKNKMTAIIGANGAGKSTLLHAFLGSISGCSVTGSVTSNGKALHKHVQQGNVAWVGQHEQFNIPLTTLEYVLLGTMPQLAWYQQPDTKAVEKAQSYLSDFDLIHLHNKRIQTLSGGEKQRLAMVRALMQNTQILFLDEPTNHLDIKHQRKLFSYLQTLVSTSDKSIIMVLHSLTDAYKYADYIIALCDGKLLDHGTPETVMTPENLTKMYEVTIDSYDTEKGKIFI